MPSPGPAPQVGGKKRSYLHSSPIKSSIPSPSSEASLPSSKPFDYSGNSSRSLFPSRLLYPFADSGLDCSMFKRDVRNAPPTSTAESMALFNDAFLNHLSLKDFPKHPTEYAFNNGPQVPLFSSVPAAYDYINPMIRNVNAPGSVAPPSMPSLNDASSTASTHGSIESRKTGSSLASSRMSGFTDQENVAPTPPVSDLSQYINPEIHATHPAFRNPSGLVVKNGRKEPRPDTFKTVMCQAWLESTYCAFGAECKFAHGESELRPAVLPIRNSQKYKTKLCDKYTTTGICPYGKRCLFIHPDPASSEAYRRHVVAQTLVHNTIGLPLKPIAPAPVATPAPTPLSMTSTPEPSEADSNLKTPVTSRPHPSWPLESPGFFNRQDYPGWDRSVYAKCHNAAGETIAEQPAAKAEGKPSTSPSPSNKPASHDAIRVAARAAAAAAKKSAASLGMSEEVLAEHLALQLLELQRTQSASSAFGHLIDEQNTRLHQTHSLPNSRHSSISPFSNASTGSTSGIWSCTQSPEDCFADNVFYNHEDNDHATPKFTSNTNIRRAKVASDSDEVSVEVNTPSADMFKNLTRTLNL